MEKTYIVRRKKIAEDALIEQLAKEKDRNAELAGYGLLPRAKKETVKNVPESSLYKEPNGNTCIGYWEEKAAFAIKEDLPYHCPACGAKMIKKDSTLDGAHVYIPSDPKQWYFIPLCSKCNNSENNKDMVVGTTLIPVPDECYEKKDK